MSAKGTGWRQKSKRMARIRIKVLKNKYLSFREKWDNESDDRGLFCNMFDRLLEAEESMIGVKNNSVWCAWAHAAEEDEKTLDEIVSFFTGETSRNGRFIREAVE